MKLTMLGTGNAFVTECYNKDHTLARRRELYTAEGQPYFSGNLWVSDDLECIEI